jgi:hypothetical protein
MGPRGAGNQTLTATGAAPLPFYNGDSVMMVVPMMMVIMNNNHLVLGHQRLHEPHARPGNKDCKCD